MKKFVSVIIGLAGLNFIIILHEFGHFLTAKWYGVSVDTFSIGFGPVLAGLQIGETFYQIALLPLGGYVSLNQAQFALQPYSAQAIIILAGIAINILFAYSIIFVLGNTYQTRLTSLMEGRRSFMGPIGIISLMSDSATLGFFYFLAILATLSFSIGMFNLLPIPLLDGGQLVFVIYEALKEYLPEKGYGNPLLALLVTLAALYIIIRLVIRKRR